MGQPPTQAELGTLRAYAAGQLGTRRAIEALGLHDYADLIIAPAQNDLDFSKPEDTPAHRAHLARVSAILQPRLRRGDRDDFGDARDSLHNAVAGA